MPSGVETTAFTFGVVRSRSRYASCSYFRQHISLPHVPEIFTGFRDCLLYTSNYEASLIRNDVDKQVNIIVSNAEAEAAKLQAEGEAEYMRLLGKAYNTEDKQEFYKFTQALEALKNTLNGDEKTIILGKDSDLAQILTNP